MKKDVLTRWQQFYKDDAGLRDIPSSACAKQAARIFAENNCRLILDLGCGAGRDSLFLASGGVMVIGLDAARSGLLLAQKNGAAWPFSPLWVESDSRILPFADGRFDGVYCFGLLHEFVGKTAVSDVRRTMSELYRVLQDGGTAVVAVSAGDSEKGLPHVQNFSEAMFDMATSAFHCLEKKVYDDLGCTGRADYKVWFGHFSKNKGGEMQKVNDVERFADFEFIAPDVMVDEDLTLKLEEMCPYNPEKKHVPEYKFAMVNTHTQTPMGKIRLRVGLTKMLRQFGGHIGYEVDEPYRGHRYAARSCRLLAPLMRALGVDTAVITCEPDNIPSAKTIESLGAELAATKEVEVELSDFRLTNSYHWHL